MSAPSPPPQPSPQPSGRAGSGVGLTRGRAALALALAAVVFVAGNLAAHRWLAGWRVDVTDAGLHTLSPATRSVLAGLEEPVVIDFYASAGLAARAPVLAEHAGRVRELLDAYAAAAGGRLVVRAHDPAPFSPAEDAALAAGLAGLPAPGRGEPVYLGLTARDALDRRQTVAVLDPAAAADLEYTLTRVIARLARTTPIRVGVLSTLPLAGAPGPAGARPPFAIWTRLAELYALRPVPTDAAAVDPDLDVLLVVHPRGLPPATLYAVDQYVLAGGRAVVFVDPYSEAEARRAPPPERFRPRHSDLGPFAAAWGLGFDPAIAAIDVRAAIPVELADGPGAARPVPYPAWLALSRPNLDRTDPITARLESLSVGSAGVLDPRPGDGRRIAALAVTSPDSARIDAGRLAAGPDPRGLIADFRAGGTPLLLAARLRGPVAGAFPDGPPEGAKAPPGGHRAGSDGSADLVVVADTDLLDDRFWTRSRARDGRIAAFAGNADFVANAVEVLAGAPDLTALRGRTAARRPFERIEALRAEAEGRLRATEQRLLAELEDAQAELRRRRADGTARDAVLDRLRADALALRAELRGVRRALDRDVAALERRLTAANIAGVPLLIALAGLTVATVRARRRRRELRAGGPA